MTTIVLETERLYLRHITPADATDVYELNSDPEVIRYTGDADFRDVAAAALFITNYKDYEKHGVGRWAAIRKADGAWLGWCGLKYLPEAAEVDLGYRLHQRYWGRGYATEAAQACLEHGFATYKYPFITGRVLVKNTASIKVLQKCGLQLVGEKSFHGTEGLYYRLNKADFEKQK